MSKQLRKKEEIPFYQKKILPWEEKLRFDAYLIWDGNYRWFCSKNVVALERYQDGATIKRVKANILSKLLPYSVR